MSKFKLLTVSIGSASMAAIFAMSHNMPFFFGSLVLSFAFLVTWKNRYDRDEALKEKAEKARKSAQTSQTIPETSPGNRLFVPPPLEED